MNSKSVNPRKDETMDKSPSAILVVAGNGADTFEEAVAKGDQLGWLTREAAAQSIKLSQNVINQAETISKLATDTVVSWVFASQEVIIRSREGSQSAQKRRQLRPGPRHLPILTTSVKGIDRIIGQVTELPAEAPPQEKPKTPAKSREPEAEEMPESMTSAFEQMPESAELARLSEKAKEAPHKLSRV